MLVVFELAESFVTKKARVAHIKKEWDTRVYSIVSTLERACVKEQEFSLQQGHFIEKHKMMGKIYDC